MRRITLSSSRRRTRSTPVAPVSPNAARPQEVGATDADGGGAESERGEDVGAATKAAVDHHRNASSDRFHDLR